MRILAASLFMFIIGSSCTSKLACPETQVCADVCCFDDSYCAIISEGHGTCAHRPQ